MLSLNQPTLISLNNYFDLIVSEKVNVIPYQMETKIASASIPLEMDQNLEQWYLGKNTANEIPMRMTGGREKSNKCNQCDFASSQAGNLRTHLGTHSGEKSNICNQCDYASSYAHHLKTHLKMHSGEKSNKCNQCDFASFQAGHLRRHMKMHSGEKSNKCNQCDFPSSRAGNMRTLVL